MDAKTHSRLPMPTNGFSLIELLLAIAVLAILLSLSAPALEELLLNQRQSTQINKIVNGLALARSEAIKRGQRVVVCKSANGETCNNSGGWEQGWIIYEDRNRNNQREATDPLLHHHPGDARMQIRYGAFPSNNYLLYYPNGRSPGNGTFTLCDQRGAQHARAVILAKSGRVRTSHKTPKGDPLECHG